MNTMVEHINSAGFSFVEFALPMLVQSGVLIVILLLADLLLRKKVKAVFRYWIWMLVLVKLVLPTSLSSPLSLGYLFGDKLTYQDLAQSSPTLEPTVPAPADISPGIDPLFIQPNPYIPPTEPVISVFEPMIAEPVSPPEVPVTPLSWQGVVFLVWLAVVIAMGLLLLQRAFFVRGLVAQSKEAGCLMNDALAYCCASMGIKSKVGLKVSVNATTPSVCGLIRPVILVPWNLASTLGASRLRTVLMHELAHIKRADLWVNLAQTVLQIIYFYNPLLWLANCVIRRIREQAVDEAVLVAMGEKAQRYPQMLVDVAKMAFKRPALSLRLIGVVESKSALAGRIKHILGRPMPKTAKLGLISILAIIIAAAVLLPMAKADKENKEEVSPEKEKVIEKVIGPKDYAGNMALNLTTGEFIDLETSASEDAPLLSWTRIAGPEHENDIGLFANNMILVGGPRDRKGRPSVDLWAINDVKSLPVFDSSRVKSRGWFIGPPSVNWPYVTAFIGNDGTIGVLKVSEVKDKKVFVNYKILALPDKSVIQADTGKSSESKFIATLPNGVTVELVGVTNHYIQSERPVEQAWWSPNGLPLESQPYAKLGLSATTDYRNSNYEFAIRLDAEEENTYAAETSLGRSRRFPNIPKTKNDESLPNIRAFIGEFRKEDKEGNIRFGVAAGPWQEVEVWRDGWTGGEAYNVSTHSKSSVVYEWPRQDGNKVVIEVTHTLANEDRRLLIVDKDGKIHIGDGRKFIGEGADIVRDIHYFHNLNRKDMEVLKFEKRPYEWVEFKDVSLQPDFETDVRVEVENDRERGSQFAATLPNGVTVELMGVCELPGQDKQWWAADGSLLEDIFWEGSTPNRESSADARQVVFRISSNESDPALAPTISFHPKRRLQPPGSWSGAFFVEKDNQTLEELRGCSFSLHDDQKSVDISADIGYGPWKTLTKLAMNSDISLPKPVFTDIGYLTWNEPTEEGGKTTVSATLFDAVKVWRIVAVDKQGDIHVSSTASGQGFDGHQIVKSMFSLPLSRIEKFRFQIRPFGEIIFKNISLEPNFKTNVQVEVEESEPVSEDVIEAAGAGISLPIRKVFSGKSDKGGSFEWETTIDPRVRFRHGWYSVVDGEVKEHVGGGSQLPDEGKLNLKLDVEIKDNMLNLKVQRVHDSANGRTEAVASKTTVPAGAYLKHDNSIDSAVLTNNHLILWQGDFIRDDKVVKSVIYAAYLTTPDDQETGFKPPGLQEKEIVIAKVRPDVQVADMKERIARGPEQVQAIDKMLREWFGACVAGDVESMKKAYSPGYQLIERDMRQINELLGMNPGWGFSLLSAMWDKEKAMAVSGALEHGDPKVGAPMALVWTFKKSEGKWGIVDIDLEELEGLQIENSRFMQKHPNAQVWFDNPDLNAPKMRHKSDVQVEGEITKDLGCFKGLEFRIVPVSVESGSIQGPLTPEQEQVYRNLLKEYGPNRPYNKSDQYIWLPAEEDIKTNTAITGEFEKQKYILVSNKPDEIMLYDGSWHVTFIDRQRDNERAVKYHSVVAGFDEYGKHLFSSLTNNHIGRTLAIIRDNKVVFASTIQRRMYQAAITGNFTEKQTAPLMVMFGQYLQVQHERKPFLWDIDRQAWREYIEATEALAKGQDRAKLAKTFLTIGSKHPQATHCQTATELGRLLESMFKEDKQFEEPEDVEALNQSKQVEYYIYKLRDVTEQDIFVPGKIHFLRDYTRMDTPVTALRKMGKDVVPVMIKHLKDRRPTRSVGSLPNGGAVTRNCDVALEIIESIAGRKFDFRTSRGTYLSTASERLRDKIIEDVKQWWQKNKQKTDVQVEGEQSKASPESKTTEPVAQEPVKQRGGISGIVVHSITGKPIAGAYVGVGDFGDSGGSNYSRHRSEGFHDKTKTDEQGRFELGGLVFTDKHRYLEYHPLVVTHPDFVRHDEKIELLSSGPVPDVKITLRPAAKIDITIVDAQGNPLEGQWLIRLEALDGRRFIPPGSDPHLSSFASSIWIERPKPVPAKKSLSGTTGVSFTELDRGQYSIDVIEFAITDNYTPPPPGMVRLPLDTSKVSYYGGMANVKIEAGRTKEVRIKPADYQTSVSINMPEDPIKKPQIPPFVLISRNTGLLLWNDGKAHGPEDHRLGRLQKNALYYNLVVEADVFTIENLPPGSYSVFAGPIYFMSATRMEVSRGREVVVDMPPIQITEHAKVGLWTFDRKVKLEARDYSVSELCELLTAMTESNPRIIADSLIENEKLRFGKGEMSVWDVLEKLYLDKGWRVEEGADKTLIIRPGVKSDV